MAVNINQYDTLSQATEDLKARGFTIEFSVDANACLVDSHDDNHTFGADQIKVVEFHRFEGESDPGDMAVIYALETPRGHQGLLIDAFGANSAQNVDEFIKHLHVPHGAGGEHVQQSNETT